MLIRVEIEPEEVSVRGNAMASGDDAADREAEDEILRRLDRGDVWAWCSVRVVVEHDGWVKASGWLGCCSYEDEEDFRKGGYFDDMVREVLEDG